MGFGDFNSRKSFFETKHIKTPPTPSLKRKRDFSLDYTNSDKYLKCLKLQDTYYHTDFFEMSRQHKNFLEAHPKYKSFVSDLNTFNLKKKYKKAKKSNESEKKLLSIKKKLSKKSTNKNELTSFVEKNMKKYENGLQIPNLAPFKIQATRSTNSWIVTPKKNKPRCETQTSNTTPKFTQNLQWNITPKNPFPTTITGAKDPLPSTSIQEEVDSTASTEIFTAPNFDTPPLSPLLGGDETRHEESISSRLNTPYQTNRYLFVVDTRCK